MNESDIPIYSNTSSTASSSRDVQTSCLADVFTPSSTSSVTNLSHPERELEYGSHCNEDTVISNGDMVELPANSEYDSSMYDDSVISVDTDSENINIELDSSVDMEPTAPPAPDIGERVVTREGSRMSTSLESGEETIPSTRVQKRVVDIFSRTTYRAAEARKRVLEESDGSGEEMKSKSERRPRKTPKYPSPSTEVERTSGPSGISKSAVASRSLNQQCDEGTFMKDPAKWARFTEAIKTFDAHAVFDVGDPRKVQHSLCLKYQKMKEPYNVSRFEEHTKRCTGPSKATKKKIPPSGSQTLMSMAAAKNWDKTSSSSISRSKEKPIVSMPCPGLTPENVPLDLKEKLETYFIRSPVPGGGGPTPDQVTKDLFPGKLYRNLTDQQKNSVRSAQRQQHQWRNHADIETVFSASCNTNVQIREGMDTPPCSECAKVLGNRRFKQAISLPLPDKDKQKYMPKKLLNETAIEHYARATGLKTIIDANSKVCHRI